MGEYSSECGDGGGPHFKDFLVKIESNKILGWTRTCQELAFLVLFFHKDDLSAFTSSQN